MRVTGLSQFLGGADNVIAFELIRGEQVNINGTVSSGGSPTNITGYTFGATAKFYKGDVSISGSGTRQQATISNLKSANKADMMLTVTTVNATAGTFRLTIPESLATVSETAPVDSTTGILIAIIFISYNTGGTIVTIRKNRVVVILRAGD